MSGPAARAPALAAIGLALFVLAGMAGAIPATVTPLRAIELSILSIGCAAAALAGRPRQRTSLLIVAAITVACAALAAALVDLLAFVPCGLDCVR
jgi:hypothetical protein